MLEKRARLTARDIEKLSDGTSVFGTLVSIRVLRAPVLKVAVASSKKIAPSAVERNRVRRRVYAALADVMPSVKAKAFVLIMPKRDCGSAEFTVLRDDIAKTFARARLTA